MPRRIQLLAIAIAGLSGLWPAPADADTVYLVDGGSYKGKVRVEGDRVIVEIPSGSITLDRDRVLKIDRGDDLYAQLAERRSQLPANDAAAHYRLGVWALSNDLTGPARDLFTEALKIEPAHAGANLALGHVLLDGSWEGGAALRARLARWLDQGLNDPALQVARQALSGLLPSADQQALLEIAAKAARRCGWFAQAQGDLQRLADLLVPGSPERLRAQVSADLLADHPGGVYLVRVDRLASSLAEGGNGPRRSGFYSLADDAVMAVALRDRAGQFIAEGEAEMAKAKGAEVTEPQSALIDYRRAEETFARADALKPSIARSYRVEVRRRMVLIRQAAAEALALRFDGMNKQLAMAIDSKSDPAVRRQIQRMLPVLDEIEALLEQSLKLASDYPDELGTMIFWTREDLTTVKAMRETLRGELERLGR